MKSLIVVALIAVVYAAPPPNEREVARGAMALIPGDPSERKHLVNEVNEEGDRDYFRDPNERKEYADDRVDPAMRKKVTEERAGGLGGRRGR